MLSFVHHEEVELLSNIIKVELLSNNIKQFSRIAPLILIFFLF